MATHPFDKSISRFRSSYADFTVFKLAITPDIKRLANNIARFVPFEQAYSFFVDDHHSQTIAFSSALRFTYREDIDGTPVREMAHPYVIVYAQQARFLRNYTQQNLLYVALTNTV